MQRISSSLTRPLDFAALPLAVIAFILGVLGVSLPATVRLVASLFGISVFLIWWTFLRKCKEVLLGSEMIVAKEGVHEITVTWASVISVKKINFIRYPPVQIKYRVSESAHTEEIVFLPSFTKYWTAYGSGRITQLVETLARKAEEARLAKTARP